MNPEERRQKLRVLVQMIAEDPRVAQPVREAFIALYEELHDLRSRVLKAENHDRG